MKKIASILICLAMCSVVHAGTAQWQQRVEDVSGNVVIDTTGWDFDGTTGIAFDYGDLDEDDNPGTIGAGATIEYIYNMTDVSAASTALGVCNGWNNSEKNAFKAEQWNATGHFGITIPGVVDTHFNDAPTIYGANVHVTFVNRTDGYFEIFVNGESQGVASRGGFYTNGGVGTLGSYNVLTTDTFTGKIFGVATYERALTPDEVVANYEAWLSDRTTASNPTPANNQDEIDADADLTLMWDAATDPNTPGVVYPDLDGHYVYFGTEGNLTQQGTMLGAAVTTATIAAADIDPDAQYFWRIDSVFDGEVFQGATWTFFTELSIPQITGDPADVAVLAGRDIEFTVEAYDPLDGTLGYQWIFDPNSIVVGDEQIVGEAAVLALSDITEANAGNYKCIVSNINGNATSAEAILTIGAKVAHWPFDGNVTEVVTGTACTPMGDPVFAEAIVGDNSIELDGEGDYIDVPVTAVAGMPKDQFSIAAWYATSVEGVGQNLFGFAAADNKRILSTHFPWSNGNVYFDAGPGVVAGDYDRINGAHGDWAKDGLWHLAVLTKDANAGVMKIYVDGALWIQGTGKSKPLGDIAKVVLGANINEGYDSQNPESQLVISMFNGKIDDLKIYDIALDAYDVAQLYYDVTGESQCLDQPATDLNNDCVVNLEDYAIIASNWMLCNRVPATACDE
ncbi:MAG: hypothetical protein JEZ07_02650 [Phycisphaerae bacterium]|nr:hypothetical protein [Phycisphaerae bacterium]